MKRVISVFVSLLLIFALLPGMAFADTSTTYSLHLEGSVNNSFTVENVKFDPNSQFLADNSTYDNDLAIASLAISIGNFTQSGVKNVLKTFGFDSANINSYDYNRTGKEEYMTGYTYATKEIERNGQPCNLLLISISTSSQDYGNESTSGWNSYIADLDFLNYEMDKQNSTETDFNSTKALTFTKAAEQILVGSSNVDAGLSVSEIIDSFKGNPNQDYLVWVVGQSRGGAIGNYLSKLLVDNIGSEHVVSYLFSVPNMDKEATIENNTSKYNTIFNIVNPDDIVTYVPFGSEGGSGWGYKRWGVDIPLDCIATANSKVTEKQKKVFNSLTKNASKDGFFYSDGNYYGYSKEEGNGIAIKNLISELSKSIPNPDSYYNDTVSFSANEGDEINILSYLISIKNNEESKSEVLEKIKSAAKQTCDLNQVVNFAIQHVFGYQNYDDMVIKLVLTNLLDLTNIHVPVKEAYIAHTPENYLSWLLAEKLVSEIDEPEEEQKGGNISFGGGGGYIAPTSYKLTFDANGHGTAPAKQAVNSGSKAIEPKSPTADGFVFGGWFTDKACTKAFDFTKNLTANTTVYAKWTKEEFDVQEALENVELKATSKLTTLNGKPAIKITWKVTGGDYDIEAFDGFDVFRSTKKNSGYGKTPYFSTTKTSYTNNKNLGEGNTYYYKVRAFKVVDGEKVYTSWSTKAWRTVK